MYNTYLDNLDKKECNGCGVCALKCPKNAIKMIEDEEGFLYPTIDEDKCINCGICRKVCSNFPKNNRYKIKAFAAKNKDDNERITSTSGGMFKILANYIIEKKGIVFGVKYDENLNVVHDYADNLEECKKFSFSKYVRSDLKDSFQRVKKFLENDKFVLFTGTPCQCYALRNYLNKEYDKLLICEIICHSNPSPKIFKMYINSKEKQFKKKVTCMHFRSKNKLMNNGPYIEFDDGYTVKDTVFNTGFNSMLFSRPSCSNCSFCDTNRKADLTIGDFWGIEKYDPTFKDDLGISLLTINTDKGSKVFNDVKKQIIYKEFDLKDAFMYNHNSIIKENKNRLKFFAELNAGKVNEKNICQKILTYSNPSFYKKLIRKIKKLISNFC